MRELFLQEARFAARLNHPNVVQTNDVGELDGRPFLSMEYLEGQPLRHLVRHWSGDARLAARIISDALGVCTTRTSAAQPRSSRPEPAEHLPDLRRCGEDRRLRNRQDGEARHQDRSRRVQGEVRLHGAGAARRRRDRPARGSLRHRHPQPPDPERGLRRIHAGHPRSGGSTISWRSTSTRTATGLPSPADLSADADVGWRIPLQAVPVEVDGAAEPLGIDYTFRGVDDPNPNNIDVGPP
jgi:hypothetical protein